MTSLAVDIANIMSGIRTHPVRINDLRSAWAIEEGSDEMAQLQRWVIAVKKLPIADVEANTQWVALGFEFAQIRYGINLERCGFIQEWLDGQNKTYGAKQSAGFLKKRFGQALKLILNHR